MMLQFGQVDALVGGVNSYSGSLLRPLIQLVKPLPHSPFISACLIAEVPEKKFGDDGVLFLADCGVVPDPNVEQLASIAVQTGLVARQVFGTRPRIAMLSFSTKGSAKTPSTEKVARAVAIVRELADRLGVEIAVDGEMQADAALIPEIAQRKMGPSTVGGKANVLIFPDLNSGNIGAKLVQYIGGARVYGQILLGLSRPAADMSRGCRRGRYRGSCCLGWPPGCRVSEALSSRSGRTGRGLGCLSLATSGTQRRNSPSLNTTTPRIFIAATEQNTGKTTTSLGLYAALREKFGRIGFIKPVGQRFVEFEGKNVDEDSVLIRQTFGTQVPIEDMSPIAVEPKFTRRYINQANNESLVQRIQQSFDRVTWEKDFAIIEGTGHAGVGSVFDLSNARVARIVHSKVILVTPAGIGRPIDEAAVNKALFDKENVEVIGVVMNKVLPEKLESITEIARKGFERLGLELLGVIPRENMLEQSTLERICEDISGSFLHRTNDDRTRVARVRIGAMSSANIFRRVGENTLLVVPGDRENVVRSALRRSTEHSSSVLRHCLVG